MKVRQMVKTKIDKMKKYNKKAVKKVKDALFLAEDFEKLRKKKINFALYVKEGKFINLDEA